MATALMNRGESGGQSTGVEAQREEGWNWLGARFLSWERACWMVWAGWVRLAPRATITGMGVDGEGEGGGIRGRGRAGYRGGGGRTGDLREEMAGG